MYYQTLQVSVVYLQKCFCLSDIRAEMMPDQKPDRSEVAAFDTSKLKHVETNEKNVMPTKEGNVIVIFNRTRFVINNIATVFY